MSITVLASAIDSLPTLLSGEEELKLIAAIRETPLEDVLACEDDFLRLVDYLELSHSDTGIIDVDERNFPQFSAFADWLKDVSRHLSREPDRAAVAAAAETFFARYEED